MECDMGSFDTLYVASGESRVVGRWITDHKNKKQVLKNPSFLHIQGKCIKKFFPGLALRFWSSCARNDTRIKGSTDEGFLGNEGRLCK